MVTGAQPADESETGASGADLAICVLAPWLIFTVTIERGPQDRDEIYIHAGGQGFWVARMIANLHCKPLLCAPVGGESGIVVKALAEAEGIELRAVASGGWNGGYVHDRRQGRREPVAAVKCARLNRHETDNLYDAVLAAGVKTGIAVLTGMKEESILPPDFFKRLARDLDENGVTVIADLAGAPLAELDGGVSFLKVSHEELIAAGHCCDGEREAVIDGIRSLSQSTGARNIVVSCAEAPALALLGNRLIEIVPPPLPPARSSWRRRFHDGGPGRGARTRL